MTKNPLNQGVLTDNSIGIGPMTRERVEVRARELAVISGRLPPKVAQADYEQAKREVTGGLDTDQQEEMLESLPAATRRDPGLDTTSCQAPELPCDGEDDEERSEIEQLIGKAGRTQCFKPFGRPAKSSKMSENPPAISHEFPSTFTIFPDDLFSQPPIGDPQDVAGTRGRTRDDQRPFLARRGEMRLGTGERGIDPPIRRRTRGSRPHYLCIMDPATIGKS